MDHTADILDANGGTQTVTGEIESLALKIGPIETSGRFTCITEAPFNVLLGRPWQRLNRVSIEEREDGTCLLFRDPMNLDREQIKYELLFPDNPPLEPIDVSTFMATEAEMGEELDNTNKVARYYQIREELLQGLNTSKVFSVYLHQ